MTKFLDPFSEEIWRLNYKWTEDRTVDDTFRRVSKAVAAAEKTEELREYWAERFYHMMQDFRVVPGGRILSNAGTNWRGTTWLNCFVSPETENPPDSIRGIYETLLHQTLTLKSEGGWGHNFSALRPRGSFIAGIGATSPGAVEFMSLFDASSNVVTSGSGLGTHRDKTKGKIRKGAMMAILDVWHPDVVEFVTAKQIPGKLTKFNVSVNCTDEFMQKLLLVQALEKEGAPEEEIEKADKWDLVFPDTNHPDYDVLWRGDIREWKARGLPVVVHQTVSARWLWNLITESTYKRAEPGVLFLDRANHWFASPFVYRITATNPCGEQALPPGGSCNLGSINLTRFVLPDGSDFDYDGIAEHARMLVRFLDNVNDLTPLPLPEYERFVRTKRRVGVGVMGWGSALYMLRVRFGSDRAVELRERVMGTVARAAWTASVDLAEEKGAFEGSIGRLHAETPYIQSLGLPDDVLKRMEKFGVRNSAVLSCQPTGHTSIFANVVSGGIEPVFQPRYIRTATVPSTPEHIADRTPRWWMDEFEETPLFKWAKEGDEDILRGVDEYGTVWKIDRNRGLTKEVECVDYGVRWLEERGLWDPDADWAVGALDISVAEHVGDLAGFARWVDSNISKTVNVPHDYPFEDFKRVYTDAYTSGYVKGVTTYRTGSMTAVVAPKDPDRGVEDKEIILDDVKLPKVAPATVLTIEAEGRKWYVTVVQDTETGQRPVATFVHTNASEKSAITKDAVERLLHLARRKGIPERHVASTERKIQADNNVTRIARCIGLNLRHGVRPSSIVSELVKVGAPMGSFIAQICEVLKRFAREGEELEGMVCPNCGSGRMVISEGCYKCANCGEARCG